MDEQYEQNEQYEDWGLMNTEEEEQELNNDDI